MEPILVVDDDTELCELLSEFLAAEGFDVEVVHDGERGVERILSGDFRLVVLDVMLPGLNGFDVLRAIRGKSDIPVVMLTARGEEVDRIVGLEMGADDYLAKPFNPRELAARIRAVLRRSESGSAVSPRKAPVPKLVVGDVQLDPGTRTVHCGDRVVSLTTVEFNVLEVLLQEAGRAVSREELTERALGRSLTPYDRSVDVHVSNIRRKLGRKVDGVERIKAIRGVGYLYTLPSA